MKRLDNSLRPARLAAGLSQAELARAAEISRQAYASIEAARSAPSTEVALRLARALRSTVETLFSLPDEGWKKVEAELMSGSRAQALPSRVQLLRVGHRLLARPLIGHQSTIHSITLADGIATARIGGRRVSVDPMAPVVEEEQLVVAGGDPSLSVLARGLDKRGFRLIWLGEDSEAALRCLMDGEAHVAGCHLFDEATGTYNTPWVERGVPFRCAVVTFAVRDQGLMVAPGNPKGIAGISHLARSDISLVNRELGSGSRALLDRLVDKAGVPKDGIRGYHRAMESHLAVADAVAAGLADVGIGVRSVALARGLGFVSLGEERYDFVIPYHFLRLPVVQAFLDLLRHPTSRRQIGALGGYDVSPMGSSVIG